MPGNDVLNERSHILFHRGADYNVPTKHNFNTANQTTSFE